MYASPVTIRDQVRCDGQTVAEDSDQGYFSVSEKNYDRSVYILCTKRNA